jgi:hypothetical protein
MVLWNGWQMPENAHPTRPWWRFTEDNHRDRTWTRVDGLWLVHLSWFYDVLHVATLSDQEVEPIELPQTTNYIPTPSPGKPCWQPVFESPLHGEVKATTKQAREIEDSAALEWMEKIDRELGPRSRPKLRCGQVWHYSNGDEAEVFRTENRGHGPIGMISECGRIAGYREDAFADAVLVADRNGEAPWETVQVKEK